MTFRYLTIFLPSVILLPLTCINGIYLCWHPDYVITTFQLFLLTHDRFLYSHAIHLTFIWSPSFMFKYEFLKICLDYMLLFRWYNLLPLSLVSTESSKWYSFTHFIVFMGVSTINNFLGSGFQTESSVASESGANRLFPPNIYRSSTQRTSGILTCGRSEVPLLLTKAFLKGGFYGRGITWLDEEERKNGNKAMTGATLNLKMELLWREKVTSLGPG